MQVHCYSEITVIAQICGSCCRAVLGLEGSMAKQTQGFVLDGWLFTPFLFCSFPLPYNPHPYFFLPSEKFVLCCMECWKYLPSAPRIVCLYLAGKEGGTARETLLSFSLAVLSNNNDSSFSWRSGLQPCTCTSYSLYCGAAIL